MNIHICETEHYELREVAFESRLVLSADMHYYILVNEDLPNLSIIIPYGEVTPDKMLEEVDKNLVVLMEKYMNRPVEELHKSAYPIRKWLQQHIITKGERNGKK